MADIFNTNRGQSLDQDKSGACWKKQQAPLFGMKMGRREGSLSWAQKNEANRLAIMKNIH